MVATASDLGIGQYAVMKFINSAPSQRASILKNCLIALLPLAIGAALFALTFIKGPSFLYVLTMASFLGLRALSIPFGALLNAVNQFKIRKAIEFFAYAISALFITVIAHFGWSVDWALMTINGSFLLGGVATSYLATHYLAVNDFLNHKSTIPETIDVYRGSMPFMITNVTGMLTYGGFIWISSLMLSVEDVAKIAVLHTFVLMNFYQLYDVFLKARQADLIQTKLAARARTVNTAILVGVPFIFLLGGGQLFNLLSEDLRFSRLEVFLFSILVSSELGFLLIQSLVQVRKDIANNLILYSAIKVSLQVVGLLVFSLVSERANFISYIGILALSSTAGYFACSLHLSSLQQRCS